MKAHHLAHARALTTPMESFLRMLLGIGTILPLSGCEAIRTIFDAGIWVGVVGVIVLLFIVGLVISLFRR